MLFVALSLGADRIIRCALYGIPSLLFVLWLIRAEHARNLFLSVLPALFIFMGIVVRGALNARDTLYALPVTLLVSLWFFRPTVLYVNVRSRMVIDGDFVPRLPFCRASIEVHRGADGGSYEVWISDLDAPAQESSRRILAWTSDAEDEAMAIVDQFRDWGIAVPQIPSNISVVKADHRLRLLVMGGHVLCAMMFVLALIAAVRSRGIPLSEAEPATLLGVMRLIIVFVSLSPIPLALYLCWLGRRVIQRREMPPPDMKLVINMKRCNGNEAVKRGRRLIYVGVMLILAGLVGALYVPSKLANMLWR
jgi:hypothetical protein